MSILSSTKTGKAAIGLTVDEILRRGYENESEELHIGTCIDRYSLKRPPFHIIDHYKSGNIFYLLIRDVQDNQITIYHSIRIKSVEHLDMIESIESNMILRKIKGEREKILPIVDKILSY
jgi:hypothetical protein